MIIELTGAGGRGSSGGLILPEDGCREKKYQISVMKR